MGNTAPLWDKEMGDNGEGVPCDPRPPVDIIWGVQYLENGGSRDMNVDGDPTPVVFTAGPTTTDETWFVHRS